MITPKYRAIVSSILVIERKLESPGELIFKVS